MEIADTGDKSVPKQRYILKGIGAVFAGFLIVVVLSIGTDLVMHATGIFPPIAVRMSDTLFVLATAYRTVYTVFGGYLAARLAPANPIKHSVILGIIGFVFALVGVLVTWNAGPEFGPLWYPISLVVVSVPSCWLGGIMYRSKV